MNASKQPRLRECPGAVCGVQIRVASVCVCACLCVCVCSVCVCVFVCVCVCVSSSCSFARLVPLRQLVSTLAKVSMSRARIHACSLSRRVLLRFTRQ